MAQYNKEKYYWIKLKQSLMTSKAVDFLMSQKDGANYVVLYQCLCLKTVNQDGELADRIGEIIIPFDEYKIQRETKWFSIDTIRVAMTLYKQLGLIYEQEDGILKITDFADLVGSQTISAYKKELQLKGRVEKGVEKIPPRDIDNKSIDNIILNILAYLNEKAGTHFKAVESNLRFIRARLDKYTEEDLKRVIDIKIAEWKGTEMAKYLRPETLFNATKFEGYVNQPKPIKKGSKSFNFNAERELTDKDYKSLITNPDDIDI